MIFIARICRIAFDCLATIHREWPRISDQARNLSLRSYSKSLSQRAARDFERTCDFLPIEAWVEGKRCRKLWKGDQDRAFCGDLFLGGQDRLSRFWRWRYQCGHGNTRLSRLRRWSSRGRHDLAAPARAIGKAAPRTGPRCDARACRGMSGAPASLPFKVTWTSCQSRRAGPAGRRAPRMPTVHGATGLPYRSSRRRSCLRRDIVGCLPMEQRIVTGRPDPSAVRQP